MSTHINIPTVVKMISAMMLMLLFMVYPIDHSMATEAGATERPEGSFTLEVEDFAEGHLQISGTGYYLPGEEVLISIIPGRGFEILEWNFEGQSVSDRQTIRFIMPSRDITLKAVFEENPGYLITLEEIIEGRVYVQLGN